MALRMWKLQKWIDHNWAYFIAVIIILLIAIFSLYMIGSKVQFFS